VDQDRLNRWITLGANVGILVGLILVGYEIKQNSNLVRAQVIVTAFSDQEALAVAQMGENYASVLERSIQEPGSVTLADVAVLESALEVRLLELRRNAIMEESGVFQGRWRQEMKRFSLPFATPIGRKYWDFWYDDKIDWMREMQVHIDSTEPTWESDYMNMLRDSLISDQDR
jgi:hypothetical protein